jgi:hypothetical protein
MPKSEIVTYEPLATGEYPIRVVDAVLEESKFTDDKTGKPKEQVKFTFDVIDTGGRQLTAWAGWPPSQKSKIVKWAKAFGMEVNGSLDTDEMIGKSAIAVVIVKTKEDGEEYNKVEEIKPLKAAKANGKPNPATADAPWADD